MARQLGLVVSRALLVTVVVALAAIRPGGSATALAATFTVTNTSDSGPGSGLAINRFSGDGIRLDTNGGNAEDSGRVAMDGSGNAYVTGFTKESVLPTTEGNSQVALAGSSMSSADETEPFVVDLLETIDAPDGLHFWHTAVKGTALYVGDRGGELLVFDSSRLSDGILFQTSVDGFGSMHSLTVIGEFLYIGGQGIKIFDISSPLQPVLRGVALPGVDVRRMALVGTRLFGIGGETVAVIDVSSPDSPMLINETQIEGSRLWNIAAVEDHIAISELGEPFGRRRGFAIYEVSESGEIAEKAFVNTPDLAYRLFFHSGRIIAATSDTGPSDFIKVYSIGADLSLTQVAVLPTRGARGTAFFESGGANYLLTNGELFLVTDSEIQQVASFTIAVGQPDGFPHTNAASDGRAFIPGLSGVAVYALTLPSFGDVNCDGLVNVIDALFVLQHDVGLRDPSDACPLLPGTFLFLPACDVNADTFCNVIDALFILQCDVGIPNVLCPPEG